MRIFGELFRVVLPLSVVMALAGCSSVHHVELRDKSLLFFLRAEDARQVRLGASVDGFTLHEAVRNRDGIWQVSVPAASEMSYFYMVDGAFFLPDCPLREQDDFGAENCVYSVAP